MFHGVEHGRFLAAHVAPPADNHFDLEAERRSQKSLSGRRQTLRGSDSLLQRGDRLRILTAHIDPSSFRTDSVRRNRHPFQQGERV